MTDFHRNLLTAGIVCAASASLVVGIAVRQRVDDASAGLKTADAIAPGLVASREHVDIPEERYFYDLMVLLKREYVEPIRNEMVLANGSVKGMISSLDDERSLFMSEPVFKAFVNSIQGKFEGIGVTLRLSRLKTQSKRAMTTADFLERVPIVKVSYVAPGGPAARAGIRAGDEFETVDGRWVVNPRIAQRIRATVSQVRAQKLPQKALLDLQRELREKMRDSIMPMRAIERLTVGSEGRTTVAWRRGGKAYSAPIDKLATSVAFNKPEGGALKLSFFDGAGSALSKALAANNKLPLDLRGASNGDLQAMTSCLGALGLSGTVGMIVDERGTSETVKLAKSKAPVRKVRLLVDGQTSGLAEAFALALKARGMATIEGGPMLGDPSFAERTTLSDGSGFTLRVGEFKPSRGSK